MGDEEDEDEGEDEEKEGGEKEGNEKEGGATTAEESSVSVSMTLNIDCQQLSADDKDELKGEMRNIFAESAGVNQDRVSVTLTQGSTVVNAEIKCQDAQNCKATEKMMNENKSKVQEAVVEAANSIPGVKNAADGAI